MPKVTVYVPDDLKARMDAVGESVNWSGEAQKAFQCALAQLEWRTMEDEMEQAVARLRASKADFEAREERDGKAEGRRWALHRADYEALERLEAQNKTVANYVSEAKISAEWLDSLMAELGGDFRDWRGNDLRSDAYAVAFVEGALEVYDEVKAHLQ